MDIKQFFKEKYFFQHTYDDDEFSVTIEGNPDDASSTVTLEISKKNERKTYITTIGEISELPKKYLSTIKKDIEEARKTPPHEHDMRQSHEDFEKAHQDMLKAHKDIEKAQSELKEIQEDLFKEFKVKIPKAEFFRQKFRSYGFDDKFEELQEQMEELMKRMAELEESAVKSKEHSEEAESEAKEEQI